VLSDDQAHTILFEARNGLLRAVLGNLRQLADTIGETQSTVERLAAVMVEVGTGHVNGESEMRV